MRVVGNIIWFLLGGVLMGLFWFLIGIIAFVTIIGIPWGRSCLVISKFSFFPFGREAISRKRIYKEKDMGTGVIGLIGNIIWLVLAGIWLFLGHVFFGLICFILIVPIPFGIQHWKLAKISLFPVGKTIVSKEVAEATLES